MLEKEWYADDVASGADTVKLVLQKQAQVIEICRFNMRKWVENHPELLENLPDNFQVDQPTVVLDKTSILSILGLSWNSESDDFQFTVSVGNLEIVWTKRLHLSKIAKIYDPLGWLSPVTIAGKIFMQSLWISKIDWDTPLTDPGCKYWLRWYSTQDVLKNIRIPRWCGHPDLKDRYELHGFAALQSKLILP